METEINIWLYVPILKGIVSGESKESDISIYYLGTTSSHLPLRCENLNI